MAFDVEQIVRNRVAAKAVSFSGFSSPNLSGMASGALASASGGLTSAATGAVGAVSGTVGAVSGMATGAMGSISNLANGPLGSVKGLISSKMALAKSLLPAPPAVPGVFNGVKKGAESYIKSMDPGTIVPSGLTSTLTLPNPVSLIGGGTTTSAITALKNKAGI